LAYGQSPEKSGLVSKALAEPTRITLENVRLVDAICKITDQTGVRIEMPPESMLYVPEGSETIIEKVTIANVPLREGLDRLFGPLGMRFDVVGDVVRIVPKEGLLCLGRTPTWAEVGTLSDLAATHPGQNPQELNRLQERMQFQVPSPDPWGSLAQMIRKVGVGPGDDVLTAAANQLGWSWCVSDDRIVVGTFDQMLRQRLRQPISIRLVNRPLIDALQAVGTAVNTMVRIEPGAIAGLPVQTQKNFSINVANMRADQVLEGIAANTGLGYLLSPDGIFFFSPNGNPATVQASPTPPSSGSSDPYVAKISIEMGEGKTFEWLIRRSELPDDLKQLRDHDIQQFIDEMRGRQPAQGHQ
jgi:hypothetical protein